MRQVLQISLGFSLIVFAAMSCDSAPAANGGTGGASSVSGSTGGTPCGANGTTEAIDPLTGGCTPAPMTDRSGNLRGKSGEQFFCLGNRQYMLQVNEWNSEAPQILAFGGGTYYFKITQQDGVGNTSGGPAGFPSMFIGANGGRKTAGSGMPKLVSSISSVPTTWNWTDNGAVDSDTDIYNATYDVWFSANPEGDPEVTTPTGGFIMVWLHKPNAAQPIGSPLYKNVTVDGVPGTWDVWIGPNNGDRQHPVPCLSYVRTTESDPVYSMSFDLNKFIRDAVNNRTSSSGTITDVMYLTNIFAGFEIWKGGVGLQTTSFCAAVL